MSFASLYLVMYVCRWLFRSLLHALSRSGLLYVDSPLFRSRVMSVCYLVWYVCIEFVISLCR